MKDVIFVLFIIWSGHAFCLDLEPAKSVLGVPWNSSEAEAMKILGSPNGYFHATKHKKLVFYGKSVVLLFKRGKLKGFRYYEACCRALYQMSVSINSKYSKEPISLDGVKLSGSSFHNLNRSLSYELGLPDYRAEIATDEVTIRLGFTGSGYPGKAEEFHFSSIEVDYDL
ncbi:hypothetical protein A3197_09370 [Candidatus Thiodiazotropha endoloripes]|nr:hypothetical protein A3197_09370 [Candidatus Thiodiazotropha endoloripes]